MRVHLLLVVAHEHLAEERLPAELALVVVGVRNLLKITFRIRRKRQRGYRPAAIRLQVLRINNLYGVTQDSTMRNYLDFLCAHGFQNQFYRSLANISYKNYLKTSSTSPIVSVIVTH